ncbi:MAG: sensor domain-containing diguanylate cyclase [Armatimonadetes bacterium]|nr:sensor domain-containing diguanylate cyclase [Armatimonadota bacterium]
MRIAHYALLLAIPSGALLLWGFPGISVHEGNWTSLGFFAIMLLIVELSSVTLPRVGGLSLALAPMLALLAQVEPRTALLIAAAAILLREITAGREDTWGRLISFCHSFLALGAGALVYALMQKPAPVLAALVAVLIYFFLDMVVSTISIGFFHDPDGQKSWYETRQKGIWLHLASAPVGYLMGLASLTSPWTVLPDCILVLALVASLKTQMAKPQQTRESSKTEALERLRKQVEESQEYAQKFEHISKQLKKRVDELSVLVEIGQKLGTNLSLENVFRVVLDILQKLFRYQSCVIFSLERLGEERQLSPLRCHTPYSEYVKSLALAVGETLVGKVAESKAPILLSEKTGNWELRLLEYEKTQMAAPMIVEDKLKGVIYIGHEKPRFYTKDDLHLMQLLAYQAATLFVYAESYESTVSLAKTDGLTGLYTHRSFQERLTEEVKRAERYRLPLALIMLDTDHFKTYNDTYGHPQGDELIKEVSQLLLSYTRETDVVCRYGGDEFAIILLESHKDSAANTAERIRQAFELRLNTEGKVKVTASIGVSGYPEDAEDKAELIRMADRALYCSKDMGRNRVTLASRTINKEGERLPKAQDMGRR